MLSLFRSGRRSQEKANHSGQKSQPNVYVDGKNNEPKEPDYAVCGPKPSRALSEHSSTCSSRSAQFHQEMDLPLTDHSYFLGRMDTEPSIRTGTTTGSDIMMSSLIGVNRNYAGSDISVSSQPGTNWNYAGSDIITRNDIKLRHYNRGGHTLPQHIQPVLERSETTYPEDLDLGHYDQHEILPMRSIDKNRPKSGTYCTHISAVAIPEDGLTSDTHKKIPPKVLPKPNNRRTQFNHDWRASHLPMNSYCTYSLQDIHKAGYDPHLDGQTERPAYHTHRSKDWILGTTAC